MAGWGVFGRFFCANAGGSPSPFSAEPESYTVASIMATSVGSIIVVGVVLLLYRKRRRGG